MGVAKELCIESEHTMAARSRSPVPRDSKIPAVKAWSFEKTSREGKTWAISHGGRPIELTLEGMFSPFDLGSFQEASTRKTLTLRLPKEWDTAFDCMEACLVHEAQEQSSRFFGQPQSPEQIADAYKAITKKNGDYPRHLKCKVQTAGISSVRYWDKDRKRISAPVDHTGLLFTAKVLLRSLWFAEDAWGIVAEATDLMLQDEVTTECPF